MRKLTNIILILSFIGLSTNLIAQNEQKEIKRHNFGIGVGLSTFPLVQNYSAPNLNHYGMYSLTNAFAWNVSMKYDFKLNKTISFSFEPTYINQRLTYNDIVLGYPPFNTYSTLPFSTSELSVPVLANFRVKLQDNINLLTSLGVGGTYYFEKEKKIIEGDGIAFTSKAINYYSAHRNVSLNKDNSFSYDFLIRAGLEIEAKHNYQILLTYRFSPNKNYYYFNKDILGFPENGNHFRVTMLELGFNMFL